MRFFIGTVDICALLPIYKMGFELNGHQASTGVLVDNQHPYMDNQYDYYLNNYAKTVVSKYSSGLMKSLSFRTANFLQRTNHGKCMKRIVDEIINKHDVFIFFWNGLTVDDSEYQVLKHRGKKIVSVFVGSDIRYIKAYCQQYKNISNFKLPDSYKNEPIDRVLKKLRVAEKYSDMILSVPDQSGMGLRPYNHFHLPIDLNSFEFNISESDIPIVVHAPSRPWLKGTDIIENTMSRLKEEGIKFEFISIRDMKNVDVRKLLTNADIVVDELFIHGPGLLSLEAMASGCVAADHFDDENSTDCFRPPVVNINVHTIYEKLKLLLIDKAMRIELAQKGRKYVEENNDPQKITSDIIKNLFDNQLSKYDYYPKFLRDTYISSDIEEICKINEWTQYVRNCRWYDNFVPRGKREQFVF